MASRDKIGALDKKDGGNGGEASCEKRASNSARRSREGSDRSARCSRLGDTGKGLVRSQKGPMGGSYNPVEAAVPTGYVAGRPGLLDTGIGTIALVEASGTTAVEMDLPGTTGTGVPVGATVTVK